MKQPTYKSFELGFKDIDSKKGIVTGYFSSFNTKDSDGDIILKGAFSKTISERGPNSTQPRIKHLLDHDKRHAVAVLLTLEEKSEGLYYESKASRSTNGRDFLLMAEDGIITEHSIGFNTIRESETKETTIIDGVHVPAGNHIKETLLWEGSSLQAWGANQYTPLTGVKSALDLIGKIDTLNICLKNGTYTDETFILLEAHLKSLKEAYEKARSPGTHAPEQSTREDATPIELLNIFRKNLNLSN